MNTIKKKSGSRFYVFLFAFFQMSFLIAQSQHGIIKGVHLKFVAVFKEAPLEENKLYISSINDSLKISALKFYISAIEIHFKNGTEFNEEKSYHLIDLNEPGSFDIFLKEAPVANISSIRFNLGVDSTMSVSGALEGDLDPGKGMYWAWQSGYINFKVEGTSSSCKTRKNEFHFHLGGYMKPNYAIRTIDLPVQNNSSGIISVQTDVSIFFNALHLSNMNSVMIPGKEAMNLSDNASKIFYIK
jgi:hypothetical protein